MPQDTLDSIMGSSQKARLMPSMSGSKLEERATSSLLASFMVVPGFAQAVLTDAGAPIGRTSQINCFTEVQIRSKEARRMRPDGLIVITGRSRTWSALVESKIGSAQLSKEQIEAYIELAKTMGVDALITISNQFATVPSHHPVQVSGNKLRGNLSLFHFSWLSLMSKAILLSENKEVEDPEQAYILSELVRYLRNDASGVDSLTKMGSGWTEICAEVQQGTELRQNDNLEDAVSSWHQLLRYLSIQLSMAVGKPVCIHLKRKRKNDPNLNFQQDVEGLIKKHCLSANFEIPNAASLLLLSADFMRRTINFSMKIEGPKDVIRPTASINWLTRQLKHLDDTEITIRAHWPGRARVTALSLVDAAECPTDLVPDNVKEIPTSFEILRVVDLAGKFRTKRFIENAESELIKFYENVGRSEEHTSELQSHSFISYAVFCLKKKKKTKKKHKQKKKKKKKHNTANIESV